RFKASIAREMDKAAPNGRELLLKTCVRIALVKDGGSDPMKTPCWFMIINLVALDMLKTKVPRALDFFAQSVDAGHNGGEPLCQVASLATPEPVRSDIISQRALSGLITAALKQANDRYTNSACAHLSESVPPVLDQVDQLAHFANSLRLTRNAINKRTRRGHRRSRSCSDTDESLSSEGFSRQRARCQSVVAVGTTSSSASSSGICAANTRLIHACDRRSFDAVHEDVADEMSTDQNNGNSAINSNDPTLYKYRSRGMEGDGDERRHRHSQNWSSFRSTTSDYDSGRELYDSAPCCSISGSSSVNLNRCQSSPLLSESEHTNETPTRIIYSSHGDTLDKSSHIDNLSKSTRATDHNSAEPPHAMPIQSSYSLQAAVKGASSTQGQCDRLR
uniref:MH2 domain-containing protein n=1 Tax=Parascaris univalens TaxID=6257 RepID=A0A915BB04_PARUN